MKLFFTLEMHMNKIGCLKNETAYFVADYPNVTKRALNYLPYFSIS